MFICYCSPLFCFSRFLRVMVVPPDRHHSSKSGGKLGDDYVLVGRCWTSCNLFPVRNLAVSQHVSSIVRFFIFFQSFPTFFCYFVYHLLLRFGTGRFFRKRRCDFQQSNVAMLVFCLFCQKYKFACLLKIYFRSFLALTSLCCL